MPKENDINKKKSTKKIILVIGLLVALAIGTRIYYVSNILGNGVLFDKNTGILSENISFSSNTNSDDKQIHIIKDINSLTKRPFTINPAEARSILRKGYHDYFKACRKCHIRCNGRNWQFDSVKMIGYFLTGKRNIGKFHLNMDLVGRSRRYLNGTNPNPYIGAYLTQFDAYNVIIDSDGSGVPLSIHAQDVLINLSTVDIYKEKIDRWDIENSQKKKTTQFFKQDYTTIIWKDNYVYGYGFLGMQYNEKSPFYIFIYNYMKASEEKYKKEAYIEEKNIDKEPRLENFWVYPMKEYYPVKPILQKGEFEKEKDFLLRKKRDLEKWNTKKNLIDQNYQKSLKENEQNQQQLYNKAYDEWLQKKRKTEQKNLQAKQEYKKKLNSMKEYEEKWLWQAVLTAIGEKDFTFTTLKYDSEKEQFDYVVEARGLNFKFEGTIDVQIAQAKAFKEALLKSLRIIFKIKNDRLYIEDFFYKCKSSGFRATSKTKLVLVDKKWLQKLRDDALQEKKRVADAIVKEKRDAIAKEKRRMLAVAKEKRDAIAKEREEQKLKKVTIYSSGKLMWQDNYYAKSIKREWKGAKIYCKKLILGKYSDWYLPSKLQLGFLYENQSPLENVVSSDYWSSSEYDTGSYVSDNLAAWLVYLEDGDTRWSYKSNKNYVRCVRDRK